ncbi:hypothetical protein HK096_002652 [Nowakowskiella sp. JEL0078]|nr:hypothetical protein HK096_002652 [Nowakowskiella sp. JEL0078]
MTTKSTITRIATNIIVPSVPATGLLDDRKATSSVSPAVIAIVSVIAAFVLIGLILLVRRRFPVRKRVISFNVDLEVGDNQVNQGPPSENTFHHPFHLGYIDSGSLRRNLNNYPELPQNDPRNFSQVNQRNFSQNTLSEFPSNNQTDFPHKMKQPLDSQIPRDPRDLTRVSRSNTQFSGLGNTKTSKEEQVSNYYINNIAESEKNIVVNFVSYDSNQPTFIGNYPTHMSRNSSIYSDTTAFNSLGRSDSGSLRKKASDSIIRKSVFNTLYVQGNAERSGFDPATHMGQFDSLGRESTFSRTSSIHIDGSTLTRFKEIEPEFKFSTDIATSRKSKKSVFRVVPMKMGSDENLKEALNVLPKNQIQKNITKSADLAHDNLQREPMSSYKKGTSILKKSDSKISIEKITEGVESLNTSSHSLHHSKHSADLRQSLAENKVSKDLSYSSHDNSEKKNSRRQTQPLDEFSKSDKLNSPVVVNSFPPILPQIKKLSKTLNISIENSLESWLEPTNVQHDKINSKDIDLISASTLSNYDIFDTYLDMPSTNLIPSAEEVASIAKLRINNHNYNPYSDIRIMPTATKYSNRISLLRSVNSTPLDTRISFFGSSVTYPAISNIDGRFIINKLKNMTILEKVSVNGVSKVTLLKALLRVHIPLIKRGKVRQPRFEVKEVTTVQSITSVWKISKSFVFRVRRKLYHPICISKKLPSGRFVFLKSEAPIDKEQFRFWHVLKARVLIASLKLHRPLVKKKVTRTPRFVKMVKPSVNLEPRYFVRMNDDYDNYVEEFTVEMQKADTVGLQQSIHSSVLCRAGIDSNSIFCQRMPSKARLARARVKLFAPFKYDIQYSFSTRTGPGRRFRKKFEYPETPVEIRNHGFQFPEEEKVATQQNSSIDLIPPIPTRHYDQTRENTIPMLPLELEHETSKWKISDAMIQRNFNILQRYGKGAPRKVLVNQRFKAPVLLSFPPKQHVNKTSESAKPISKILTNTETPVTRIFNMNRCLQRRVFLATMRLHHPLIKQKRLRRTRFYISNVDKQNTIAMR